MAAAAEDNIKNMKVTSNTTLAKIIEKKGAGEILVKNGVPCLSCPMASFEVDKLKIGEVCKMYGLDLKKILKDLNGTKKEHAKSES